MIATWMLGTLLFSACVFACALAAERVAVALDQPRRVVWIGAMLLMVITPFLPNRVTGAGVSTNSADAVRSGGASAEWSGGARAVALPALVMRALPAAESRTMDNMLLLAWGLLSFFGACAVGGAHRRLRHDHRSWSRHVGHLDGAPPLTPIWIAHSTGPAAFGLRTMQVVLPEWVFALSASERALVLDHEAEHVRAGDPRMLAAVQVMAILVPWNLPLLAAAARMRRAMEFDCDLRVVRRTADRVGYAQLLLTVASRIIPRDQSSAGAPFPSPATLLAAGPSGLEGRVRALAPVARGPRIRRGIAASVVLGVVALVAVSVMPWALLQRSAAPAPFVLQPVPPSFASVWSAREGRSLVDTLYPRCNMALSNMSASDTTRDSHRCMEDAIRYHLPELVAPGSRAEPLAWLVLSSTGHVIGAARGFAESHPGSEYQAMPGIPRFRMSSDAGDISASMDDVRRKFPRLTLDGRTRSGVTAAKFGSRTINIIYVVKTGS
jgi:beta-lactamase regulating signal transducer with metallopeptidase domain